MSYRDLQERLSNLLARRTLNGQTPGGTPPTVPDGRRRQDAPGETLVGGSDKLVDTAAPTHVQTMIDAVAVHGRTVTCEPDEGWQNPPTLLTTPGYTPVPTRMEF